MYFTATKYRNKSSLLKKMSLLCIALVLAITAGIAQEQRITFSRQDISRREAVNQIKNQTGYYFAINHTSFNDNAPVYFTSLTLPLREAMNQLLSGTNLTFMIKDSQILIFGTGDEEMKEDIKEEKKVTSSVPYTPPVYNYREDRRNSSYIPGFDQEVKAFNNKRYNSDLNRQQNTLINRSSVTTETLKRETRKSATGGRSRVQSHQLPLIYTDNILPDYSSYLRGPSSRFAVKVNAVYGLAALTPNLGLEVGLSPKTTLDLTVGWNPFNKEGTEESNKKFNHLLIKPELRYWLCERFNGHFFGVHPFYANYNISEHDVPLLFEKEYRYEGNGYGLGVSYGYHWMLNKRFGIEFNVGVGMAFLDYEKFKCKLCSDSEGNFKKKYFGPTSLGIKLVYIIK